MIKSPILRVASCALLGFATYCLAQTGVQRVGRLRGQVLSLSGSAIRSAEVIVVSGTREVAHVQTDNRGYFSFDAVPATYQIHVSHSGFSAQTVESDFNTDSDIAVFQLQPEDATRPGDWVGALANRTPWEYGVLVQGGNGLTEDRDSFHFLMAGVHLGRVLTPELGHGLLKGDFEYAVEVFPFWQSYTPKFQRADCVQIFPGGVAPPPGIYVSCSAERTVGGTFTGVSIVPIILRWNLTHGRRLMPWVQGAGGVVWTNHKYPAFGEPLPSPGPSTFGPPAGAGLLAEDGPNTDASVWNFTPQFGVGAHYFVKPRRSVDFSANAVHISSSSLGDKNPGVNASVQFSLGYTWWK